MLAGEVVRPLVFGGGFESRGITCAALEPEAKARRGLVFAHFVARASAGSVARGQPCAL